MLQNIPTKVMNAQNILKENNLLLNIFNCNKGSSFFFSTKINIINEVIAIAKLNKIIGSSKPMFIPSYKAPKSGTIANTNNTAPKISNLPLAALFSFGNNLIAQNNAITPIGTFIKNIYSQLAAPTISPPSPGPIREPKAIEVPKNPRAFPLSLGGNVSVIIP
ncbi:hypothetical protein CBEIJ_52750 [Clostridium beijerinckii]|nr:hypothetical protein CBEIJ_52750 [Clostridium beijerinckii]